MEAPVPPAVIGKVPVVSALELLAYMAPPLVTELNPVPPLATGTTPEMVLAELAGFAQVGVPLPLVVNT